MNVSVVHQDKASAELHLDNITVAEIMRVYAVEQGADFVAWRREHPSKLFIFMIKSEKGVSKTIGGTVSAIKKDLDSLRAGLKK